MRWVLFVAVLVWSVVGLVLGWWLGKKSKRAALITVAFGLFFVLLRAVFRYVPVVEFSLVSFDAYALIRPWWAIPFGMLVLGVGTTQMSTPLARKGVGVFAVALLLASVQRLWKTATFDPSTVTGVVSTRTGVCEQTTNYTCGAAAAATLLQHCGVAASEREMAELSWTNSLTGTDEFCVARGLRRKLVDSGRRVQLTHGDWEELSRRVEPCMVTVRWSFLIDHWVVVREAKGERVLVADPLSAGVQLYTKAEFLQKWSGVIVSADLASAE